MNKQQLANRIWASANKLRGKIEASEYKDYILGLIFYKYLSDAEVRYFKNEMGLDDEDLPLLKEDPSDPDITTTIDECRKMIGYFIEYDFLFSTWLNSGSFNVAALSSALKNFERSISPEYQNVFKGIFNNLDAGLSKLGSDANAQTRALKELISIIKDVPTNGTENYDVLGYIYEFLISNFAASAGKKAGEFYTPHEVAMVMSQIVADHHHNRQSIDIYDPTSGSGSLLITIGKAVSKHMDGTNKVKYFAQELKEATYNLTRMNLVMRGIVPQNIITKCADTLSEDWPIHEAGVDIDKPLAVDAVVSNPPYSQHWAPDNMEFDPRFAEYGVAPKTKADYAFLLHELHHLKKDGIMTIVLPHGVLFRGKTPKIYDENGVELPLELQQPGQAEGKIRASLIEKNNIDAVIGLPPGIFFGTGIPTIIMVLRKNRGNEGVLFIDASRGFVKDGKQNRLRASDIKRITDTYRLRTSSPGYSREVSRDEIRLNEYNLNIPRYVDSAEAPEMFDIFSTVFGGIPQSEIDSLSAYWKPFPSLPAKLFSQRENQPYFDLASPQIRPLIEENPDVVAFQNRFREAFRSFRQMMKVRLIDNIEGVREVVEADFIADDIMARVANIPLVDPYALYQILSDNWQEIIGDIEIIQSDGFKACNQVEPKYKTVRKNDVEIDVPDGEKGRIFPFELVQKSLLADQLNFLNLFRERLARTDSQLEEIREALDEDEQALFLNEDASKWDGKKITSALQDLLDDLQISGAKNKKVERFMAMTFEADSLEDKVQRIVSLREMSASLKKEIQKAEADLALLTRKTIESLSMHQIVELLQLKWIEPIAAAIDATPAAIIAELETRVEALARKYAETYADIERDLATSRTALASLVDDLTGDPFAITALKHLTNP